MKRAGLLALALALAACRPDSRVEVRAGVEAPVESADAIPDAPASGTVRGAPFVVRDARYVVDRRVGYAHTDILLSSGKADAPCGAISPARATSVWLRLEGGERIEAKEVRVGGGAGGADGAAGAWSVHYQAFDGDSWVGVGEGRAVVAIRETTADGRVTGGVAVCFGDEKKSCVSGSFDAVGCPATIDQPVRGAVAPEAVPRAYLRAVKGGGGGDGGR